MKNVTVKHIAEQLNISMMTVSRALNGSKNVKEETKKKVLKKAKELGYVPNTIARSLVQKKSFTIGMVVPAFTTSFFPRVIKGIEEVVHEENYQLILGHSNEDGEREIECLNNLASKRVDGLLVASAENITKKNIKIYKEINKRIPLVFYDRCVEGIGSSCVGIDDRRSSEVLTDHLIEMNYKRIAHLAGKFNVSVGLNRMEGYKISLLRHQREIIDDLIVETGFKEEEGYVAMGKLLNLPKSEQPDAVVCANDQVAFGAIKRIEEAGLKIPDDIAIAGFSDDERSKLLNVPLTTVSQPAYDVGQFAAKILINRINNEEEEPRTVYLNTDLLVRESTKKTKG